jgi:hypothetical protein
LSEDLFFSVLFPFSSSSSSFSLVLVFSSRLFSSRVFEIRFSCFLLLFLSLVFFLLRRYLSFLSFFSSLFLWSCWRRDLSSMSFERDWYLPLPISLFSTLLLRLLILWGDLRSHIFFFFSLVRDSFLLYLRFEIYIFEIR